MKKFYIAIDDEYKFKEISENLTKLKIDVFPKDLIYEDAIFDLIEQMGTDAFYEAYCSHAQNNQ